MSWQSKTITGAHQSYAMPVCRGKQMCPLNDSEAAHTVVSGAFLLMSNVCLRGVKRIHCFTLVRIGHGAYVEWSTMPSRMPLHLLCLSKTTHYGHGKVKDSKSGIESLLTAPVKQVNDLFNTFPLSGASKKSHLRPFQIPQM